MKTAIHILRVSCALALTLALLACSGPQAAPPPTIATDKNSGVQALTISPSLQAVDFGSGAQLTAAGGMQPYTYSVENCDSTIDPKSGAFSAASDQSMCIVVVTDGGGGAAYASVAVGPALQATYTPNPVKATGIAIVLAVGGVPPYQYQQVSGKGTLVDNVYFTPTTAESASVMVVDAIGNSQLVAINVEPPPAPANALSAIAVSYTSSCPSGYNKLVTGYGGYGLSTLICGKIYAAGDPGFVTDVIIPAYGTTTCPGTYTSVGKIEYCANDGCPTYDQPVCVSMNAAPQVFITNLDDETTASCKSGETESGSEVDSSLICETKALAP